MKKMIIGVLSFLALSVIIFLLRTHSIWSDVWGVFNRPSEEMTRKWEKDAEKWKEQAKTPDQKQRLNDFEIGLNERKMKERIGQMRNNLSMLYGDNLGVFPKDVPSLLAFKQMATIPPIELANHPGSSEIILYDKATCLPGNEGGWAKIDSSKLKDTGKWGYVVCTDSDGKKNARIFVDCTHADKEGRPWCSW